MNERHDTFGRIVLADGRSVVLAPVKPQDSTPVRAFVSALSVTSRYRRFHAGLRELSPGMSRALTEIDQRQHVAFAARPARPAGMNDGPIVAVVRYALRADRTGADFAIAVADKWQGAGPGRELLTRLSAHARARRARCLFGEMLWSNSPMIELVRSLGGRFSRTPGDWTVVRAELGVEAATGAYLERLLWRFAGGQGTPGC